MPDSLTKDELLALGQAPILTTIIQDVIHEACKTSADVFAADTTRPVDEHRIASLLVADEHNDLMGALKFDGLIREELM